MSEPSRDRAWMTPVLNRIADIAGERAAILLGREKACRQIYIPDTVDADHWLAKLIGLEPAQKLAEAYGSKNITIPPVLVGSKRRRADALDELNDQGLSINEIAATLGVARQTVINHRARRRDPAKPDKSDDDQGSLF